MPVTVLVGTEKGAWILRSDDSRQEWDITGPIFKGWKVTASGKAANGDTIVGTASHVYGAAFQRSADLEKWRQVEKGPVYTEEQGRKLNQIWTVVRGDDVLYAGVDEAGLFRSDDDGESWEPIPGLNDHPTRGSWFPGAGGLCAHAIVVDPGRPERVWCGISAVGVFRTDDGGATWTPRNEGVPVIIEDKEHKDIGYCVHGLVPEPGNPDRIYRQDHLGMFRTDDGGDSWERIEEGLPSRFGFPIGLDRASGSIFVFPLESDEYRLPAEGRCRIFRSDDQGYSWHDRSEGLPQENAYGAVLRGAMATDGLDPGGIYFGTTAGSVFVSSDGGDSWRALPCTLPRILTVEAYVE